MPSALITGITGQDGSYLKELLSGKRYAVHDWKRDECDVTNPESLRVALQQSQPDDIYHLDAQTHVGQSVQDEAATMEERWGDLLRADPAHSPNLALDGDGFSPAGKPRVVPPWRA